MKISKYKTDFQHPGHHQSDLSNFITFRKFIEVIKHIDASFMKYTAETQHITFKHSSFHINL